MRNRFQNLTLLLALALMSVTGRLEAFTLGGPFTSWQATAIGYDLDAIVGRDDFSGPMNLSEEYRVNVPRLNYAFDATFLTYFGAQGETAINQAFDVLNTLPSADSIDLNNYPLQAKGPINFTALNLNLIDIKSLTLGTLLAQIGIGAPERYVWCLRDRATLPNNAGTNYLVIQRNFDPFQPQIPTNAVNGTIYTYTIFDPVPGPTTSYADAVERPVDPAATDFSTVAGIENPDPARGVNLGFGEYFTGLTREDVAAWKYLYSRANFNIEDPPTGVTLSTNSSVNGSPFVIVGVSNLLATNVLVTTALRPGVGDLNFNRIVLDSLVGSVLNLTNEYVDNFITNGSFESQVIERVQTEPDILFAAGDIGTDAFAMPLAVERTTSTSWNDNSALNTLGSGAGELYGPGVIEPNVVITFNRIGPHRLNANPFFQDERTSSAGFAFGHFDTANIFAIFPNGSNVDEVENRIRAGETTDPGLVSPFGP